MSGFLYTLKAKNPANLKTFFPKKLFFNPDQTKPPTNTAGLPQDS